MSGHMSDSNQFDSLASPSVTNEGKSAAGWDAHSLKDDMKQQAAAARDGVKQRAVELKESVISTVNSTIEFAKDKVATATGNNEIREKSNEQLAADLREKAEGEWETVKRKGNKQAKRAEQKLDENLTPQQKLKLKQGVSKMERGFNGVFARFPQLKPAQSFIRRYHLQLPIMIVSFLLFMYFTTSFFSMLAARALTPAEPPHFDIHSKENSYNWLKFHAGEYKDKAMDMKESLSGRAAAFLANHEWEKLKGTAVDWKEIGINKLGLAEPTFTERALAYFTGRPLTWQNRVESVLTLAKQGIQNVDLSSMKEWKNSVQGQIKNTLGMNEPTTYERVRDYVVGRPETIPEQAIHQAGSLGERIIDGVKGSVENLGSKANYVKNRVVHGAQEAAHIAQDRANEAMDKAKLKVGL